MEDILGVNDRLLEKKVAEINRERAEGKRPPGPLPEDLSTGDELLDRIVRAAIVRREKRRPRRGHLQDK